MQDRCNKSLAYLVWKVALETLHEPESGLLIEFSEAVLNNSLVGQRIFIG